jgi:UDP-2-acetamido-3-amino-2,3-dideoxy-glucuronate N-acetyltransferase
LKLCVHESDWAPGLMLGHDVEIGEDVSLGANVVIHSGTKVGDGCEIQDNVVLGKRPRFGKRSLQATDGQFDPLVIEPGVTVCTAAIIFAGSRVAAGTVIGDQAHVRERCTIGADTIVGQATSVENDVTIGARVKVQTNCYLTAGTVIEDEVFVAPCVVTTNDNTMGRHADASGNRGPVFRRRSRIGGGAVIVPGVVVGEEAFVAAGAVLTRDAPPRAVMIGVPAKQAREVADDDLWARWG